MASILVLCFSDKVEVVPRVASPVHASSKDVSNARTPDAVKELIVAEEAQQVLGRTWVTYQMLAILTDGGLNSVRDGI